MNGYRKGEIQWGYFPHHSFWFWWMRNWKRCMSWTSSKLLQFILGTNISQETRLHLCLYCFSSHDYSIWSHSKHLFWLFSGYNDSEVCRIKYTYLNANLIGHTFPHFLDSGLPLPKKIWTWVKWNPVIEYTLAITQEPVHKLHRHYLTILAFGTTSMEIN